MYYKFKEMSDLYSVWSSFPFDFQEDNKELISRYNKQCESSFNMSKLINDNSLYDKKLKFIKRYVFNNMIVFLLDYKEFLILVKNNEVYKISDLPNNLFTLE